MFLFEVVWEGAMSAYSAFFGVDEITGMTPMIQEARNIRVDKLVLAVVGQRDFDTSPPHPPATRPRKRKRHHSDMRV
jgi:hypothetical protein